MAVWTCPVHGPAGVTLPRFTSDTGFNAISAGGRRGFRGRKKSQPKALAGEPLELRDDQTFVIVENPVLKVTTGDFQTQLILAYLEQTNLTEPDIKVLAVDAALDGIEEAVPEIVISHSGVGHRVAGPCGRRDIGHDNHDGRTNGSVTFENPIMRQSEVEKVSTRKGIEKKGQNRLQLRRVSYQRVAVRSR